MYAFVLLIESINYVFMSNLEFGYLAYHPLS
jgi:hypothetical protein